jgi:transaldolase
VRLLLDTGDPEQVRRWSPLIEGVTTNRKLLAAAGADTPSGIRALILAAGTLPVSIPVGTLDTNLAFAEASDLRDDHPNLVVKVPIVGPRGEDTIPLIRLLQREGLPVNVTGCTSVTQVLVAGALGVGFVSLLLGRITDQGLDGIASTALARRWIDRAGVPTKLIAASIRAIGDVSGLLDEPPHFVTLPPTLMTRLIDTPASRAVVGELMGAGEHEVAAT